MSPDFLAMRSNLVARGLLSPELRLTEAGNAHALQLLAQLDRTETANDSAGPRVRWNFKGRGLCPLEAA